MLDRRRMLFATVAAAAAPGLGYRAGGRRRGEGGGGSDAGAVHGLRQRIPRPLARDRRPASGFDSGPRARAAGSQLDDRSLAALARYKAADVVDLGQAARASTAAILTPAGQGQLRRRRLRVLRHRAGRADLRLRRRPAAEPLCGQPAVGRLSGRAGLPRQPASGQGQDRRRGLSARVWRPSPRRWTRRASGSATTRAWACAPPDFVIDKTLIQLKALRDAPRGQRRTWSARWRARAKAAGIDGDWAGPAGKIYTGEVQPALIAADRPAGVDARRRHARRGGVAPAQGGRILPPVAGPGDDHHR